jgi:hypothetical protein
MKGDRTMTDNIFDPKAAMEQVDLWAKGERGKMVEREVQELLSDKWLTALEIVSHFKVFGPDRAGDIALTEVRVALIMLEAKGIVVERNASPMGMDRMTVYRALPPWKRDVKF